MSYTTDWKPTATPNLPENLAFRCIDCRSKDVEYREWESSDGAHDDYHYRCKACGRDWWIEGSDY